MDKIVAPYLPERFETAVEPYLAHRLRYAPALIARLAEEARLGAESVVLDLGCGPGFIAGAIAPFAGQVIGVDPSPAMLAAARAEAPANVRYVEGSSYDLSFIDRPLALVTMGRSFHWMDREATLETLDGLLAPGGLIALLGDKPVEAPGSAWWRAANAVVRGFAPEGNFHEKRTSADWVPHEELLDGSAFSSLSRISVFARHERDFDDLVGFFLSRSDSTEERLGARKDAMIAALRDALAPFGPGPWRTLNEHSALIARRPG